MFSFGRASALDHYNSLAGKIGDVPAGGNAPQQQQGNSQQVYWYIYCMKGGQHALMGPYNTQQDAANSAREKISGWSFRILGFRTRNRAAAVQMLKHDIASGGKVSQAIESMRHSV